MAGFSWRYDAKEGEFKKVFLLASNVVQEAGNAAVFDAALAGVKSGRANIAATGFPKIWQSSLRFKMLTPKSSTHPLAYIHTRINYADVFERGANVAATGEGFIWLPLPSVPRNPGSGLKFGGVVARNHMTPQQYVRKVGPLKFISRPGKAPLLGAVIRRGTKAQPFGKFATRAQLKRGVTGRGGLDFIPLFVGVKSVRIGKKWDLSGALRAAAARLPDFYEDELRKIDAQKLLQG